MADSGGVDEKYVIEFVLKNQEAVLAGADAISKKTQAMAQTLIDMAKSSGQALDYLAESMIKVAKAQAEAMKPTKAKFTTTGAEGQLPKFDAKGYKEASDAYKKAVKDAQAFADTVREGLGVAKASSAELAKAISADTKQETMAVKTAEAQKTKDRMAAAQAAVADEKQKQAIAAELRKQDVQDQRAAEAQKKAQFQATVSAIEQEMLEQAQLSSKTYRQIAAEMKAAFAQKTLAQIPRGAGGVLDPAAYKAAIAQIIQMGAAVDTAATRMQKGFGRAGTAKDKFKTNVSGLGKIVNNVFTMIVGGSGILAIYKLVQGFKAAIEQGTELARNIMELGVAVRSLQFRGLNVTMADTVQLMKELKAQFPIFPTADIMKSVSDVYFLMRNFNFTQEQLRKTSELTLALSTIMGKDVGESARQLALFYSSGYSEALQRVGIAVNRLTVAEQAHKMGIDKSYMALTEMQRANAGYALVEEQTKDTVNEATKAMGTRYNELRKLESQIQDTTQALGYQWLPLKKFFLEAMVVIVKALASIIQGIIIAGTTSMKFFSVFTAGFMTIAIVAKAASQGIVMSIDDIRDTYLEAMRQLNESITAKAEGFTEPFDLLKELMDDLLNPPKPKTLPAGFFTEEQLDAANGYFQEIIEAQEEFTEKSIELEEKLQKTLAEIDAEWAQKRLDIFREYCDKMTEIESQLIEDLAEAEADYQESVAEENADYAESVADANRKYREAELKAERDFQERMRRLREEFLFDLEDALRERDALQVLRLIRRYNLDRSQAQREYEQECQDRLEAYKQELEDLKKAHAERLAELRRDYEQRKAELEAQAAEDRAQAALDREKAYAEADAARDAAADAAQADYDAALQALKDALTARITEIIKKMVEEGLLTEEQMKALLGVWAAYLGENGLVEMTTDYYLSLMDKIMKEVEEDLKWLEQQLLHAQEIAMQIAETTASSAQNPQTAETGGSKQQYQSGGSLLATQPTSAVFGEVPELVQFTPLSKLNTRGLHGGYPTAAGNFGGGGSSRIEIWLSPGLEGKIIDDTMGALSGIFVDIKGAR